MRPVSCQLSGKPPLSQLVRMPRFEEMNKGNNGNESSPSSGLDQGLLDLSVRENYEDIGDQHQLLEAELVAEGASSVAHSGKSGRVQRSGGSTIKTEAVYHGVESSYDSEAKPPPVGMLKGVQVSEANVALLTRLLIDESSWLSLFEAQTKSVITDQVTKCYNAKFNPDHCGSMIAYASNLLKALGLDVVVVVPDDITDYALEDMAPVIEELRRVVHSIFQEAKQAVMAQVASVPATQIKQPTVRATTVPTQRTTRSVPQVNFVSAANQVEYDQDEEAVAEEAGQSRWCQGKPYVPMDAIPNFTGKAGGAEDWLNKFIYVADQANWSNKMRCDTFRFKMIENAKWWFQSLPSTTQKRWTDLKDSFKKNYEIGVRDPVERYWSAYRKESETPLEYLTRFNAYAKSAKIDRFKGKTAMEHVQRYLITLNDKALSDKLFMLDILNTSDLEERLRTMERGQKKALAFSKRHVDDRKAKSAPSDRKLVGRAAAAYSREVRWVDEDAEDQWMADYYQEEADREYAIAYSARESYERPEGSAYQRRPEQSYQRRSEPYPPRQDWKNEICRDCGRKGHPTERCLFRCRACSRIHDEGICPVVAKMEKLEKLARFAKAKNESGIQEILRDLNY